MMSMKAVVSAVPNLGRLQLAHARIRLTYLWRHGRWPNLSSPKLFTELVQLRKLEDRNPRMPLLADKVRVKEFVASRIGPEWVIPTLWQGIDLPCQPPWPTPFVVKSRHGCNQRIFVRSDPDNWETIRDQASLWLKRSYGQWLDEWLYDHIPRGLLIECFVGEDGMLPVDWKFYVFGGRVCFVQVHLGRETNHRWIIMDRHWRRVSTPSCDADPAPPAPLKQMIAAAEELARGFDFVRVDMYEVAGRPLFGEMTFYPGSGLDPFDPPCLDKKMGCEWLASQRTEVASEASPRSRPILTMA